MKRTLSLAFALALAATLSACDRDGTSAGSGGRAVGRWSSLQIARAGRRDESHCHVCCTSRMRTSMSRLKSRRCLRAPFEQSGEL